MSKDKLIISAYGSHNGGLAMYYKGQYFVVEAERWVNEKNMGISNYLPTNNMQLVFDQMLEWLLAKTDRSDVDVLIKGYLPHVKPNVHIKETLGCDHHVAHAACSFYQSPYDEALVITFDGGGDSGFFNIYKASRHTGFKLIDKLDYDLGFPYMILSDYLDDIKKEPLNIGNLVYAGKLMGLCSYGKIREEWKPFFEEFYESYKYAGSSYIGGAEVTFDAVPKLMQQMGIEDFEYGVTRFEGQLAWDIAATTQWAFENQFYKLAQHRLDEYKDLPLCLSGGCALNVLLNTKLAKERNGKVFIPPNTNDCGLAAGQLLWYLAPEQQIDLTYSGLPMMDTFQLSTYLQDRQYDIIENISLTDLATYIANGFIVGFLQGNSEHGSRALGNRSILCNPAILEMKDILNEKVKHREWYRPFAPLVKLEEVDTYFNFYGNDSRHMTFVADVKEEWKAKLPAITHEDGTGRLQTVTRWQNEAIYDLLTEFKKATGQGVILNTSFNDNGKPILTRFSDALSLLRNTKLDAVYYHERKLIIFKNGEHKKFKRSLEQNGVLRNSNETSVNVFAFAKDIQEMRDKFIPVLEKLAGKVERLTVITEPMYVNTLREKLSDAVNIAIIDKTKHYSYNLIKSKAENFDDSTYFFSQFVKPFWIKDVLRPNFFDTEYHLFIDLSLMDDYNYDVVRDIKMLIKHSKEDMEGVGITGLKDHTSIFDVEFLNKRFNGFVPDFHPLPYIYYGNLENLDWFSTNYEGMINWYLGQGRRGTMADYILVSYAENRHRYKFLELEKV